MRGKSSLVVGREPPLHSNLADIHVCSPSQSQRSFSNGESKAKPTGGEPEESGLANINLVVLAAVRVKVRLSSQAALKSSGSSLGADSFNCRAKTMSAVLEKVSRGSALTRS